LSDRTSLRNSREQPRYPLAVSSRRVRSGPTPEVLETAVQAVADGCALARRIQHAIRQRDGGSARPAAPDAACSTSTVALEGAPPFGTLAKGDASPVTIADFAIQALVAARLERVLGAAAFRLVGEESAAVLRDSARAATREAVVEAVQSVDLDLSADDVLRAIDLGAVSAAEGRAGQRSIWTIDPIDGTKGFLRGGQYAVCLAAIEGSEVVAAILGCPNIPAVGLPPEHPPASAERDGILLVAERGAGCHQRREAHPLDTGQRVHRPAVDPGGTLILCESVESRSMAPAQREALLDAAGIQRRPVRLDSQCKYALVARGDADIYLRIPRRSLAIESIWDHASGVLCVEEAGGATTDLDGAPLDFGQGRALSGNRGIVACARELHQRLVEPAVRGLTRG
jgi:3'(2'), 5'-bisphosphate nucleotidase